jgi:lysophospholipase L1-like esterase
MSAPSKGNFYSTVCIIIINTLIVFALINGIAEGILRVITPPSSPTLFSYFWSSKAVLRRNPDAIKRRYPGKTDAEILALISPPNMTHHPVLEFIERPVSSNYYTVSEELYRASSLTPTDSDELFNNSLWVFGGSTIFGHGVGNDDTIPAYLDRTLSETQVINLAVQGSHFSLDLDRLIYLLKKGYRPTSVLFINGVNDITKLLDSPFAVEDTPAYIHSGFSWAFNVSFFNSRSNAINAAVNTLPLITLIKRVAASSETPTYRENPIEFYKAITQSESLPSTNSISLERDTKRVQRYYYQNTDLLSNLAEQYGFSYTVVLQPNGFIFSARDFIKEPETYAESAVYNRISTAMTSLQDWITDHSSTYRVIDLSNSLSSDEDYIDIIHYSAKGNKRLATAILNYFQSNKLP